MKTLTSILKEYLTLRRSLGYKLTEVERYLNVFLNFLKSKESSYITSNLALEWIASREKDLKDKGYKLLSIIRIFAQYAFWEDSRNEVPSKILLPQHKERYLPYIYKKKDILQIMNEANRCFGIILSQTYYNMFGLLASTGMRQGEAIKLDISDFKAKEGILVIRKTKYGKSRELILHETTIRALENYIRKRNIIFPNTRTRAIFINNNGNRVNRKNFDYTFQKILSRTKLNSLKPKPRLHDLRHTFVVRTIERWYKEGKDVEMKLPLLSTYLGHVSPSSTYWYLTAIPELMACATDLISKKRRIL